MNVALIWLIVAAALMFASAFMDDAWGDFPWPIAALFWPLPVAILVLLSPFLLGLFVKYLTERRSRP